MNHRTALAIPVALALLGPVPMLVALAGAMHESEYAPGNAALLYHRYWAVQSGPLGELIVAARESPDDQEARAALDAALVENQTRVEGLLRASRIPHCDFGIEYEDGIKAMLPHLQSMRGGARLLWVDAERIAPTDPDGAAERIAATIRMAIQLESDRVLISNLVGVALVTVAIDHIDALMASGDLTADGRDKLLELLRSIDPRDPLEVRTAIVTEEDVFLTWVEREYDGPDGPARFIAELGEVAKSPNSYTREINAMSEREFDAALKRAHRAYADVLTIWDSPDAFAKLRTFHETVEQGVYGPVAQMLMPNLSGLRERIDKFVVKLDDSIDRLEAYRPSEENDGE